MSFPLSEEQYLEVIASTKLISVDLIIRNQKGEVLLGYRNNKPAQHSWFVPGGAIRKDETIASALNRVTQSELGYLPERFDFFSLAQHDYPDNFANAPHIETSYIVLGFSCSVDYQNLTPDDQHGELKWWPVEELLAHPEVHLNTKAYFSPTPDPSIITFRK